jgi:Cellulase (glycosyl hydrolase family 5)
MLAAAAFAQPAPPTRTTAASVVRGDDGQTFALGPAAGIHRERTWLRDQEGRYALFRGVNVASRSKLPPYVPFLPLTTRRLDTRLMAAEMQRLEPQIRSLQDAGMNVVRLLVIWKALEPEFQESLSSLPPSGREYLAAIRQVVDRLYAHGLYVILDFHQDIASEAYGGDGFPDWALSVDAEHPRPRDPPPPDLLWGIRYFALPGNALSKAVRSTMQAFWRDAVTNTDAHLVAAPARSHLVRVIGLVAASFSDHPGVLGYEPFNEPHQAGLPKESFERDVLGPFYAAVIREVSRNHPSAFVFPEPRLDWTTYPADAPEPSVWRPWSFLSFTDHPRTFLDLSAEPPEAPIALSFHYYDPALFAGPPFRKSLHARAEAWPAVFREMDDAVRGQQAVPFLTEFGCDQGRTEASDLEPGVYGTVARACLDRQYREIEARLFDAIYWNYDFYSRRGPDGRISENWNQENLSLLGPDGPRNLDVASRPYPMRSSARPERVAFDFASRQGAIVLAGEVVATPTIVFVPHRVHYAAAGFEIRATSLRAPEWDPSRGLLAWWPDPGQGRNALIVSAAGRFDPAALPAGLAPLLPRMKRWVF